MSADLAADGAVCMIALPLPADTPVSIDAIPTDPATGDAVKTLIWPAVAPDGTPVSVTGAEPDYWKAAVTGVAAGDGGELVPLMATSGLAGGATPDGKFEILPARADALPIATARGTALPFTTKFAAARREAAPTGPTGSSGSASTTDSASSGTPTLLKLADSSANDTARRPLLAFRSSGVRALRLTGDATAWRGQGLRNR